jgi:hypothetical protein
VPPNERGDLKSSAAGTWLCPLDLLGESRTVKFAAQPHKVAQPWLGSPSGAAWVPDGFEISPGLNNGGERGIRTPDTRKGIHAFEARAFSHSAISPRR